MIGIRGFMGGVACIALVTAMSGAVLMASSGRVLAQEQAGTSFSVPAQPLAQAVNQIARTAGLSVVIEGSTATQSNPVSGSMPVEQALDSALAGTGASWRFTAPGSLAVTLPAAAPAAVLDMGDGTVVLDTVVITAAGFAQSIIDAPASITVIPSEELEKRAYSSLQDAVRDVEGVSMAGGVKGDISIRGMPADGTLILVDGRRQNSTRGLNPKGGNAVDDNWMPPIGAVERIEVVRGPMGSRYGSEAMGGVINIITKKVADEWGGSVGVESTFPTGSDEGDGKQVDFYLSGPIVRDRLGLQFWGYRTQRDEDEILGGQNDFKTWNGTARLWYTPNTDHDLMFEYQRQDQDYLERAGRSASATTDTERDYRRESMTLAHTGRWSFGTSELSITQDKGRREAYTVTPDTGDRVEDNWSPETRNTTIEGSMVMPLGAHTLSFGASWQREKLRIGGQRLGDGETGEVRADVTKWSIFVEDEWQIRDNFNLTLGARYDDNEIYGGHVSPRVYGIWHIDDTWTVKAGVASGFKAPTMREYNPLFGNPQRGGATTWGNPDLEPETSLNKEIGVYYDAGGPFTGNVTLFHTDYDDKIANTGSRCLNAPEGEPTNGDGCWIGADGNPRSLYFNVPEAVMQGVELAGRWEIDDSFTLSGNWTFVDSKMKTGDISIYGFPLGQADGLAAVATPRHVANLRLDWQARDDLSTYLRVNYRGKDNQGVNWGGGSSPQDKSAGDIVTVDLGGSWQISDQASFNFGVLNVADKRVYDPDVTTRYQYMEEGRRVWLGLRSQF